LHGSVNLCLGLVASVVFPRQNEHVSVFSYLRILC